MKIMDNLETLPFRVRQQYALIAEWFKLNGGRDKNGDPKHPEVPSGLPPAETATLAQIQLIAELFNDGILEKYKTGRASNGVMLGMIAEELRAMMVILDSTK